LVRLHPRGPIYKYVLLDFTFGYYLWFILVVFATIYFTGRKREDHNRKTMMKQFTGFALANIWTVEDRNRSKDLLSVGSLLIGHVQ
jgi:hypothetical protein